MLNLTQLAEQRNLLNLIDWEMTPEEAVRLYLEWGNNWARGNYVIRSKNDVSHYFVVNTWSGAPTVYLVRRNSDIAEELADIPLPDDIGAAFMESIGYNKGVYTLSDTLKRWLQEQLRIG